MKKVLVRHWSCFNENELSIYSKCKEHFGNSGNCVFVYGLEKCLRDHGVDYECNPYYENEYINDHFSCVIEIPANIFGPNSETVNQFLRGRLDNLRVPVIFMSPGIQAKNLAEYQSLPKVIGESTKKLLDAVYKTGGEFGVRGAYTKEFLDIVCPSNTSKVIGCISTYQFGRDIQISNNKLSLSEFNPIINGHTDELKLNNYENLFNTYKNAEYMDQDEFGNALYDSKKTDYISLVRHCSRFGVDLLKQQRVNLFFSIPEWKQFLNDKKFNFSFGTRIHGSLMSLSQNIPALVWARDLRVKELCDFYSIPNIDNFSSDLYNLYLGTDYSSFNKLFSSKFTILLDFLVKNKIIDSTNLKNCENMTEFNISQAHIDKICRNIKTPSKRMLAIKLFNTYIKYIIYKGVGGGQDQFLDIRTIKYLLGILKV